MKKKSKPLMCSIFTIKFYFLSKYFIKHFLKSPFWNLLRPCTLVVSKLSESDWQVLSKFCVDNQVFLVSRHIPDRTQRWHWRSRAAAGFSNPGGLAVMWW